MKVYKLTKSNYTTYNNTLWGEGVTHETSGEGELCGLGWLHYYHHPILANLLNPVHAQIRQPLLWEAEAEGKQKDDYGLKGGCTKLTTIKQIPLPELTLEQRVEFAIRSAKTLHCCDKWIRWADNWLSGEERNSDIMSVIRTDPKLFSDAHHKACLAARARNSSLLPLSKEKIKQFVSDCIYDAALSVQLAVDLRSTKVKPLNLNEIIAQVFPNYGG